MKHKYTFKNIDVSDALRKHAESKVIEIDQSFPSDCRIETSFWMYGDKKVGQINVVCKGQRFFAKEYSDDFYKTIDRASKNITRQIQNFKKKGRSLRKRRSREVQNFEETQSADES